MHTVILYLLVATVVFMSIGLRSMEKKVKELEDTVQRLSSESKNSDFHSNE
ncbi:hypothetical protein GCM10008932_24310 [Alkalibacterium iburiense]|uniref:Uncharacterized protein n=1 Tax=Alkalibacterium iburiense TaxID=290589 RepID=A0ABN0XTG4_9LACT